MNLMCKVDPSTKTCDYCGLPLGSGHTLHEDQPHYCCYGCSFAAKITQDQGEEAQSHYLMMRLGFAIFFTMNIMVLTLVLWSWDVFASDIADSGVKEEALFDLLRYTSLLLTTIVLLLLCGPLIEKSVIDLQQKQLSTELLLTIGVFAAYIYSTLVVLQAGEHTYFEVCAMILVATTLGRWLEATSKLKTTESMRSLEKLLPDSFVFVASGSINQTEKRPLEVLKTGDLFRVLPGQRIVTDAIVEQGHGAVDQQLITGESLPKEIVHKDQVIGGSTCLSGELILRATAPVNQGTLKKFINAVQQAALSKGHWQKLADRLTMWFLPSVFIIAMTTLLTHSLLIDFQSGLMAFLSVTLIACPCALALATPMATWIAMTTAAKEGVLLRDGDTLDRLAQCTQIFIDKTGTLTTGEFKVQNFVIDPEANEQEVKSWFSAAAQCSTHRLSHSILDYFNQDVDPIEFQLIKNLPGKGIILQVNPEDNSPFHRLNLGNLQWMQQQQIYVPSNIQQAINQAILNFQPIVCLANDNNILGVLCFSEEPRAESARLFSWAEREGYPLSILTGDHSIPPELQSAGQSISSACNLLPEEKLAVIQQAKEQGNKVIMIGDGLNDAPSLKAAEVGIALGCGADLSRDAADVCLLNNDLEKIAWIIQFSKLTRVTIKQNLVWASIYNVVGIFLASIGLLNPILAAIAMLFSSFIVIGNSLKLASFDPRNHVSNDSKDNIVSLNSNESTISALQIHKGVVG